MVSSIEIYLAKVLLKELEKHKELGFSPGNIWLASDSKYFAKVFDSKNAILSEDTDHNLNFYNLAAQKLFGYSHDEAIGCLHLI